LKHQTRVELVVDFDLGNLPLNGWWTKIDGYVFDDTNRNGVKDAGEAGIPGYTLTMRRRENSQMDRGSLENDAASSIRKVERTLRK